MRICVLVSLAWFLCRSEEIRLSKPEEIRSSGKIKWTQLLEWSGIDSEEVGDSRYELTVRNKEDVASRCVVVCNICYFEITLDFGPLRFIR